MIGARIGKLDKDTCHRGVANLDGFRKSRLVVGSFLQLHDADVCFFFTMDITKSSLILL